MSARTITTAPDQDLVLEVTADACYLTVETAPDLTEARLEMEGEDELVEATAVHRTGPAWSVEVPDTPAAAATQGGVVNIASGVVGMQVGGDIVGGVVMSDIAAGGGVIVNDGITVLGRSARITGASAPLRLRAVLPEGARLRSRIRAGAVRAHGPLAVHHAGVSTDVTAVGPRDLTVDQRSGRVRAARVTGALRVRTTSGEIDIDCAVGHPIEVDSASGPVRLRVRTD